LTFACPDGKYLAKIFSFSNGFSLIICGAVRTMHGQSIASVGKAGFDHLFRLCDGVGVLQHAKYMVPDREHGYCTDDNARALILALRALKLFSGDGELLNLACRCLSFMRHALNSSNGRFRNFMGYDRRWLEHAGSEDSHGRALWSLGETAALSEIHGLTDAAANLFNLALPASLEFQSPRGWAFSLLGIACFPEKFWSLDVCGKVLETLGGKLYGEYCSTATEDWPWIENEATYANARVCQALMAAGRMLGRQEMVEAGFRSLDWLAKTQSDAEGRFAAIGNQGWLVRGGRRARFDQQPIEAQCMIDACIEAYGISHDRKWLSEAQRCFNWFLGENELNDSLFDDITMGCRDGLTPTGPNLNQGAESTIAWLLSLVAMRTISPC